MRIFHTILLAASAVAIVQAQAPNVLTAKEKADGWILLFDGKSLDGWEPHNEAKWSVVDGAIKPEGNPGWLGTAATYKDFALSMEFRCAENINSGVFFRNPKEGRLAYEVQIWNDQPGGYNTGSIVGIAKASEKILRNQWNRLDITAEGEHLTVAVNGAKSVDVQNSKASEGVVGLQFGKDNPIEFRNIKLRPLPR
jgi:hypothetical protein